MFKPSPKAILVATVMFVATCALPGTALAKQGGNRNNGTNSNGGGPPACRDLQGEIDQLQTMITTLNQGIATINANVNTINTNVNTLNGRINTLTTSVANITTTLNTFNTRFDGIEDSLATLEADIADIQATLDTGGVSSLNAEVVVDETACVSGASQCGSATAANSTNQNPVAVTVLVMEGTTPVTNLTSSNFQLETDFAPNGTSLNLVMCTSGKTGCGSGSFLVNSGSGGYQLWVSPTANWVPGTYVAQLKITDTEGHSTTELVKITIPS